MSSVFSRTAFYSLFLFLLFLPSQSLSRSLNGSQQLLDQKAKFSWQEAESKSLKILVEYKDAEGNWKQSPLGSGFLISAEGLFVTAYHVMKYCLENQKDKRRFSAKVDCSEEHPLLRYKARNGNDEFEIEVLSHLREKDATNGRNVHTPDEIIKHRDFVIGKVIGGPGLRFPHWQIRDFEEGKVNVSDPTADFELKPLLPPKKVFVTGYPASRDFIIADGFLNLTEDHHRGYFAADLNVYRREYLMRQGLSPTTRWGISIENHMSGGAVVDPWGYLVGLVVNGDTSTAGILSIENVLETFFSRSPNSRHQYSIHLVPTEQRLYLKDSEID